MKNSSPLLPSVLIAATSSGCPHAFGKGGTLDRALRKDIYEKARTRNCRLSREEWEKFCFDPDDEEEAEQCTGDCLPD